MSELVEEMRVYYARRAPVYDASMGYDDPATVERLQPVADALGRQLAGRDVLEIACGPGFWTRVVSGAATSILATDCNETVLRQARLKALDPAVVTFAIADAYDLAPIGRRFSGAFGVDWLAHVPSSRLREFLDGLRERLVPGSRVVFCDQTPRADSITALMDDEGNHLQERELPDGSRYRVIKHFWTDDQYRAVLEAYGSDVTLERIGPCRRIVVGYTSH